MTIQADIEKHMVFDTEVREYIKDCIQNGLSNKQIMVSFEKYIKEVRN